ncbi:hypothetical protein Tco_1110633 [Tanacetum coccineum]|uniref:Uncharacterized protein n=1 Tax=Tanacetum coccineum TaxID=301880 RepID=A0ABQ5IKV5_9ASTR
MHAYFRSLHSASSSSFTRRLKGTHIEHGFQTGNSCHSLVKMFDTYHKNKAPQCRSTNKSNLTMINIMKMDPDRLWVVNNIVLEVHRYKVYIGLMTVKCQHELCWNTLESRSDDADIKPVYDKEPMAEVQLTAEYNIFAIGQQHTEQPEIIVEGRVDQYPETCQVKSPMLDSSPDNQTTEYSKQSLSLKIFYSKKPVEPFSKRVFQ